MQTDEPAEPMMSYSGFLPIPRGKCRGHLLDLLSIRLAIDENKLVGHGYKRSAESRMENQLYK